MEPTPWDTLGERPMIDWHDTFARASDERRILAYLAQAQVPMARWGSERNPHSHATVLHYAASSGDEEALVALIRLRVPLGERSYSNSTPAHWAAVNDVPRSLLLLAAAGAPLTELDSNHRSALDVAVMRGTHACVCALLVAGVRLARVGHQYRHLISPELEAFERGVLRCRAAVVAMLRVKRASGQLVRWDKFLLAELALCIWATRCDKEWHK